MVESTPTRDADDVAHMQAALALGRRGLGNVWPNPSVGCVVVRDGRVVARAHTAPGGRPHAETLALAMAGELARGATIYVTLEPCAHYGATPPCTDALIAAGVARVVVAMRDPNPVVNGAGMARLHAAGIVTEEGLLADAARDAHAGFVSRVVDGRPLVTLKLASTLDGRIATHGGESRWITGESARRMVHGIRGQHDAVMVGVGTVLADDPDLTCRLAGVRPVPLMRIVADSRLRTPLTSRLVTTAGKSPTWLLARPAADHARRDALLALGVTVIEAGVSEAGVALPDALRALARRGITRLLVEGGGQLAAALLRDGLVDRIVWFHAPAVMGGDGWPAVQSLSVDQLARMPRFVRDASGQVGADILTELRRAA